MEMLTVLDEPGATGLLLKSVEKPGWAFAERETLPANPFIAVMVAIVVLVAPEKTMTETGLAEI